MPSECDPRITEEMVSDACAIIENRCGIVRGIGPAMREALAAVYPLIEQAVIERLAGEAGENPYLPADDIRYGCWEAGAAAGVAAERARLADLIENEGNERA